MNLGKTKSIVVVNHKGGCGKTTTVVNLAAEFAAIGLDVLIVDLDPQANCSQHIGLKHPMDISVTCAVMLSANASNGQNLIADAIHQTKIEGVDLIYASLDLDKTEETLRMQSIRPFEQLATLLPNLSDVYDVILFDCPPSLGVLTSNALAVGSDFLIPMESGSLYNVYGIPAVLQKASLMRQVNPEINFAGVLMIRHDDRQTACQDIKQAVISLLKDESSLGVKGFHGGVLDISIPASAQINQSNNSSKPAREIRKNSKVAVAYRDLANYFVSSWNEKSASSKKEKI